MAVQFLKPGVHIVIHGSCYPVNRVKKDHAMGRFVWTDEGDQGVWDQLALKTQATQNCENVAHRFFGPQEFLPALR
jgi:hypothetical protein